MIKGVKICGVSDLVTLNYILNHHNSPKFIGFICNFKASKRYVPLEKLNTLNFDYYQLYDVNPTRTKFIKEKYKRKIISALTVERADDVKRYELYKDISDIILFDGKGYEKSIGFNHNLLNHVSPNITKMIAGNINIDNIPDLKNIDYFIDLSGSLENDMGKKDLQKIDNFLNKIKKYEN